MHKFTYYEPLVPIYKDVHLVLEQYAGAATDDLNIGYFVDAFTRIEYPVESYRFCGHIGYSGTFYRKEGYLYVHCDEMDLNDHTMEIIEVTNEVLAEIRGYYVDVYPPKWSAPDWLTEVL